ncbi:hypothetical protein CK203_092678 [Vitis vinifera]|uniref:Uncharacterized protein n=1 Tax=Vitis vinifera TaxID=29760 RepID=A0A438EP14_VITVI|nr:hypothetical protein CK203_092678 [Vitis vinifera]
MQHYMLGDGKGIESVEKSEVKIPVDSASENVVTEKTEETPAVTKEATEAAPTAAEEIIEVTTAASQEATPAAKDISEATQMLLKKQQQSPSPNVPAVLAPSFDFLFVLLCTVTGFQLETAPADFRSRVPTKQGIALPVTLNIIGALLQRGRGY